MRPIFPMAYTLCTVAAALAGYYVGKSSGMRKSEHVSSLKEAAKSSPTTDDEFHPKPRNRSHYTSTSTRPQELIREDGEDEDDEDEAKIDGTEYKSFDDLGDDCKMVLVVRTDLGMTKGKMAAQCGHATLMCYKSALVYAPKLVKRWETWGQTKVAVQAKSEDELQLMQAQALSLGVVARIVHDAGRTQIAAGSATVLGLGPAPRSVIDQISGHLKLL